MPTTKRVRIPQEVLKQALDKAKWREWDRLYLLGKLTIPYEQ